MHTDRIDSWAGTVSAGATVRLPAFSTIGWRRALICVKASHNLTCWLEHGRATDTVDALPWGSEATTIDSTYNTAGGGQPIYLDVPAGSEQAQVVLHNAGLTDATARVDVGVE